MTHTGYSLISIAVVAATGLACAGIFGTPLEQSEWSFDGRMVLLTELSEQTHDEVMRWDIEEAL